MVNDAGVTRPRTLHIDELHIDWQDGTKEVHPLSIRTGRAGRLYSLEDRCHVLVDDERCGPVRSASDKVRPGQVRPGQVRPGQVRPGQVRPGQVRPGQVRPGQAAARRAQTARWR